MGVAVVKKNIRNAMRMMDKSKDSEKQLQYKQQIRALLAEWEASIIAEIERKHALVYKKVKFFERQKAKRKCDKNTDDKQALIEYAYTTIFPKTIKYISIYPQKEQDEQAADRRSAILDTISRHVPQSLAETSTDRYKQTMHRILRAELDWLNDSEQKKIQEQVGSCAMYLKAQELLESATTGDDDFFQQ